VITSELNENKRFGGNKIIKVHPQHVVDENQQRKTVLIPLAEWEQILDYLEEFDDIHAYD
jgi:hypothetical protein